MVRYIPDRTKTYSRHAFFLKDFINHLSFRAIAEIGVCHGELSRYLLATCPSITDYYLVDPWERYPDEWREADSLSHWEQERWDEAFDEVLEKMAPHHDAVHILRMTSVEGAKKVEDESLDMAYIDALHHYKPMMEDIRAWWPKVKPSGVLAGHDWWDDGTEYAQGMIGVMEAVLETFPREIIHIGSPSENWDHAWLIWKADFQGEL